MHVFDFGAAPAIDRLIIIADCKQHAFITGQNSEPGILDAVGVLKLINEHVPEPPLVMSQYIRPLQPQFMRPQQQFGKVDQAVLIAIFLIGPVNLYQHRPGVIVAGVHMIRSQAFIFLVVYKPLHFTGHPGGVVQPHVINQPANQPLLILRVNNLEAFGQTDFFGMAAQQAVGKAMKGAYPQVADRHVQQFFHPAAHFGRCFVGESHGEYAMRR